MTDKIRKWDDVHGTEKSEEKLTAFLEQKNDGYAILQLHRGRKPTMNASKVMQG